MALNVEHIGKYRQRELRESAVPTRSASSAVRAVAMADGNSLPGYSSNDRVVSPRKPKFAQRRAVAACRSRWWLSDAVLFRSFRISLSAAWRSRPAEPGCPGPRLRCPRHARRAIRLPLMDGVLP